MNGYVKYFDSNNKCMNLLVRVKELFKKYNALWNKISNLLQRGSDSKPVYDNKYIKNNIKIYNNRINANFLEVNKYFAYLSAILLESAVKIDNDYCLQIFLEECKYALI